MSTVFYGYWLDKSRVFEFKDKLLKFWIENNILFTHFYAHSFEQIMKYSRDEDYHLRLQLFDMNEDKYLIRILANGYLIENNIKLFEEYITPCYYDNRSDVTEDEEMNLAYVEKADQLIRQKYYFVVYVIDDIEIRNHWFDKNK